MLLIAFTMKATAQSDDPQFPKFGKVTEQDFKHTEYDDLGQDAVILLSEKSMYFEIYNGQLRLYRRPLHRALLRHERIRKASLAALFGV